MRILSLWLFIAGSPLLAMPQVFAQNPEREKFAGNWILNGKKSTKNYRSDAVKWRVSLTGDEFRIQHTYTIGSKTDRYELTFFTDGRGEQNDLPAIKDLPGQKIVSKTKWDKNSLVRRYKTYSFPSPMFSTEWIEKFKISKDGNRLTVELRPVTSDFPAEAVFRIIESVFDREK